MQRSDYTHKLTQHSGRQILVIEDLDQGNMSVTNNIENVIREIEKKEHIDVRYFMVVYKDSDGIWDGWNPYKREFLALRSETWPQAVDAWVNLQVYHNVQ